MKYTLTQYNIAQYCRQELCCRFPYSFRLAKAKDRLSTDEGSRCQFFIHKHSLLYHIRDIFPLIVRVQLCTASQHIKPNLLMTFIKFSFSFLLLKNPGPLKILWNFWFLIEEYIPTCTSTSMFYHSDPGSNPLAVVCKDSKQHLKSRRFRMTQSL